MKDLRVCLKICMFAFFLVSGKMLSADNSTFINNLVIDLGNQLSPNGSYFFTFISADDKKALYCLQQIF